MVGRHLALLKKRRHQSVGNPPVRHALANRIDLRVVGLHRVIDHNAAIAINSGRLGQRRIRANAHSHDHQICRDLHAVLETNRRNPTAFT